MCIGLLGSLFSFLQFLTSPLLGATSDIFGRKRMLILCMVRGSVYLCGVCGVCLWCLKQSNRFSLLATIVVETGCAVTT